MLGAVARLPEFQFLDKNSKFKSGGRTYKSFKMLARAVRTDAVTGRQSVLAQVESDSFKVCVVGCVAGCVWREGVCVQRLEGIRVCKAREADRCQHVGRSSKLCLMPFNTTHT